MSQEHDTLDVTIAGREYRVACTPAEREELLAAVQYVDERMRELAGKTRSGGERLAVMTALNIAHELLQMKLPGGVDLADFRRRIASMQARLDQTLAHQEKLF